MNNVVSSDGYEILTAFLKQVYKESKDKEFDEVTIKLLDEL